MTEHNDSYSTSFTVGNSPTEVLAAISDPRAWWMADLRGATTEVGDEFSFEVPGVHYAKFRVTDLVPGRLVVWTVIDGQIRFVADPEEWNGTQVRFELSPVAGGGTEVLFTHVGLRPDHECYDACTGGWNLYAGGSLRSFITTGAGQPNSNPDEVSFAEDTVTVDTVTA